MHDGDVYCSPFGSHVAERLLDVLAQQVEDDGLGTSHAAYTVRIG